MELLVPTDGWLAGDAYVVSMSATINNSIEAPARRRRSPTIVVGYDGSDASSAAVRVATRQATPQGRVVIVNAYDLPPSTLGYPEYGRVLADRHRAGGAALDAAIDTTGMSDYGPEFESKLLAGPPAQALQTVACVEHADEIVVGVGGRDGVEEPLGKVARELLGIADRPVVLVASA